MARYLLQHFACCLLPVCILAADPCSTWHGATFVEDRCLLSSDDELPWEEAKDACVALGGRLTEPRTGTDLSRLSTFVRTTNWLTAWVGLIKLANISEFRWLSDGTVISSGSGLWGNGQPRLSDGSEDHCVRLQQVYSALEDVTCQTMSAFVCERDISDRCAESLPGGRYILGYCFKLMPLSSTWREAKKSCEMMNAFLAETKTSALLDGVLDYLGNGTGYFVWLGGSDEEEEGVFKWVTSGDLFGNDINTRWIDGDPNNSQDYEHHLAIILWDSVTGLVDMAESARNVYICQAEPTPVMDYIYIAVIPTLTDSPALQERFVTVTTSLASHNVRVRITAYDSSTVLASQVQLLCNDQPVFLSLPERLEVSQTGTHQKYVKIEATKPVTVILWYWGQSGAGSTLIYNSQWLSEMPERGLSYFLPASSSTQGAASHLAVVAMDSGSTNVTLYFWPREQGVDLDLNHIVFRHVTQATATLSDKYEAAHILNYLGTAEAFVHASQPVGVFWSNVDAETNPGDGDYVIENVLPIEFLDSEYVTFPTLPLGGVNTDQDVFLLVAVYDNTTFNMTVDGNTKELPLLSSGQIRNLHLPSSGAYRVQGNQPFYMYKLSSWTNDLTMASSRQSCMTSLMPRRLWSLQYDFLVPPQLLGFQVFVVVVADTRWIGQLGDTLQRQNSSCGLVETTDLSWCYYNITDDINIYKHIHLEYRRALFAAYMYAFDQSRTMCHSLGIATIAASSPVFDYQPYLNSLVGEKPAYCDPETTSVFANTTTEYTSTDVINTTTTADVTSDATYSINSTIGTTSNTDLTTESISVTTEKITPATIITPTANAFNISNLSAEEIQILITDIRKHLYVDIRGTSAFLRTKISVPDYRPSSQAIGLVGITFLALALAVLLLSDLTKLIYYLTGHCDNKGKEKQST